MTVNLVKDGSVKEVENEKQQIERKMEPVSESLDTAREATLKIALCREKTGKQIMLEVPMRMIETTLGIMRHLCCCRYRNSRRTQARDRPHGCEYVDGLAPFKLIGTVFYFVWGLLCQLSSTLGKFLESCSQNCVVQRDPRAARHGRYFHPRQGVHGWIGREDPEKDCTAMKIFCCGKEGRNACEMVFKKTMEAFSQTDKRLTEDDVIDYLKKRFLKEDKGQLGDDSKHRVLSSQRERLKTVIKKLKPRKSEAKPTEPQNVPLKAKKSTTKTKKDSNVSLVKIQEVKKESDKFAPKNVGEEDRRKSSLASKLRGAEKKLSTDEDEKKKLTRIKSSSFSLSSADEGRNTAREYIRRSAERSKGHSSKADDKKSNGSARIKQVPPPRRYTKESTGSRVRSLLKISKDKRMSEDDKSVRFKYEDKPQINEFREDDRAHDYRPSPEKDFFSMGSETDDKLLSYRKNKAHSNSFLKFWKGHDKNADKNREFVNKDATNEYQGSATFSEEERKKKGFGKLRNFVSGLSISSRTSKNTATPVYSPPVPIAVPIHPMMAEEDDIDTPPSLCEEDRWGSKRDQLLYSLDSRPSKNGNNRNNNKPATAIQKQAERKSTNTRESVENSGKKAPERLSRSSQKKMNDEDVVKDSVDFDIISQTSPRDSLDFVLMSRGTSRSSGKQNMEEKISKSLLGANLDDHGSLMSDTPASKVNQPRDRKPSRIRQLRLFQKKKPDPVQTSILKSVRIESESFSTQDESPRVSALIKLKNDSPSSSFSPAVSVCEKKSILKKRGTGSNASSARMSLTDQSNNDINVKTLELKMSNSKLSGTNGYFKTLKQTLISIRSSFKEKKGPSESLTDSNRASPIESTYRKTTVSFFPIPSYSDSRSSPTMSPDAFDAFKELDEEELLLLEEAKKKSVE